MARRDQRCRSRQLERGSGTVLAMALVGAMAALLVAGLALGSAVAASHRARAAADLGSLAAALAVQDGAAPHESCAVAGQVVQRNVATLLDCVGATDQSVTVQVGARVGWSLPGAGPLMAKARSRAGPSP